MTATHKPQAALRVASRTGRERARPKKARRHRGWPPARPVAMLEVIYVTRHGVSCSFHLEGFVAASCCVSGREFMLVRVREHVIRFNARHTSRPCGFGNGTDGEMAIGVQTAFVPPRFPNRRVPSWRYCRDPSLTHTTISFGPIGSSTPQTATTPPSSGRPRVELPTRP
jgi:hypothetical protein